MDDTLFSYYNRELAYIRNLGAEFAEAHPKIAGRLRLDHDIVEDPHVSRLIESFAFLTARIRHTLDDSFPELTEALMGVLYPDYHAPIPSMAILNFWMTKDFIEPVNIQSREELITRSSPESVCNYQSTNAVTVYPMTIEETVFRSQPVKAPVLPASLDRDGGNVQAVLRMSLSVTEGTTLSEICPNSLKFFINGQPQLSYRLYEMLMTQVAGIAIAEHPGDPNAVFLPSDCIHACGMDQESTAIPVDGRSSTAHRLLAEFFAFPEKFLFIELRDIKKAWADFGEKAHVYIYFKQTHPELVQGVNSETLQLGCTTIVNLFEQDLDSVDANEFTVEHKIIPDIYGNISCADIHTITDIYASRPGKDNLKMQPFYGSHRDSSVNASKLYWVLRREPSQWFNGRISHGTDSYLSFVDADFKVTAPDESWTIGGKAICVNRDIPEKLPFGPGLPEFGAPEAGCRSDCITPPTPTIQPRLNDATRWQLVTQLSLQHFASDDGLHVLKNTLRLYDFKGTPTTDALINGIISLETSLTTARVRQQGRTAICQGTEIMLGLDEQFFSGSGLYLFASILSEFFAQYCTINTFVQLKAKVKQRPGTILEWPPRNGNQTLV